MDSSEPPIHPFLRTRLAEAFGGNISRFAEACDSTPSMASKWVTDDTRRRVTPSPASCQKIAKGLRLDPDYVLTLAKHRAGEAAPLTDTNPRLAAFLSEVESGWQAMDDAARDIAERTARALFHVDPVQRRRRVTDRPDGLGKSNVSGSDQAIRRTYPSWKRDSRSLASERIRSGFMPA